MPIPSTLNEALAEIEILQTQMQYLAEQADIAGAIEEKDIPDYSDILASMSTNITNIKTAIDAVTEALATAAPQTPPTPSSASVVVSNI